MDRIKDRFRMRAKTGSALYLWRYVVASLIALGIFRVANLVGPVHWVDEVATSMRVSGLTVADLQRFQKIRYSDAVSDEVDREHLENRPLANLFSVLAQSPEHAPLYFVLARFWAEVFGGSPVAMRSLWKLNSPLKPNSIAIATRHQAALGSSVWDAKKTAGET